MLPDRCDQMTQTAISVREPYYERTTLLGTPKDQFGQAVKTVDPDLLQRVCNALKFTVDKLIENVFEMSDTQYRNVLMMLSPLNEDSSRRTPSASQIAQLEGRLKLDFRYRSASYQNSLIFGPLILGHQEINLETSLLPRKLLPKEKVILQCASQYEESFPPSLSLWMNDIPVIIGSQSIHKLRFIDATRLVPSSTPVNLKIKCSVERDDYVFVIRCVEKLRREDILKEIMSRRDPNYDIFDGGVGSDSDLFLPARSSACAHIKCFDLRKLLKRALPGRDLVCPVCQRMIQYKDVTVDYGLLRGKVSYRVEKLIKEMRDSGVAMSELKFDRPIDPGSLVDVGTQRDVDLEFEFTDVGTMTFEF